MSVSVSTGNQNTPSASPAATPMFTSHQGPKTQRVLSCALCQQRKVRCDRKFPCANCTRARAKCVQATITVRRRRRRFPERELLARIRRYEELLRQTGTKFEPLPEDPASSNPSTNTEGVFRSDDDDPADSMATDHSSPSAGPKPDKPYSAKNFWNVINQAYRDRDPHDDSDSSTAHDHIRHGAVVKALDKIYSNTDHLLFGSRKAPVDLSSLQPSAVHILRLWQTFVDNVNPLLKVVHPPSLQGRIIEAASNLAQIDPNLEALMFGIYCMAIFSLTEDEIAPIFSESRDHLLTKFQFGCQQALLNAGFLRTTNSDCLTALLLYLISIVPSMDPRSLSSLLGMALRIAQRMGLHSESLRGDCTVFQAEMRRRLWWALVLFDTRISELASSKTSPMASTWDCEIPLNVNDADLQPELKGPPSAQETPTDAICAVVRSEVGRYLCHAAFRCNLLNPASSREGSTAAAAAGGRVPNNVLTPAAETAGDYVAFEKMIEDRYLRHCDPTVPLHFVTIWTTRSQLAKYYLIEHYAKLADPSELQTDRHRDIILGFALRWIECDTRLMTFPPARPFLWLAHLYYPFPAYIQIVMDLKYRPLNRAAAAAWDALSRSYAARSVFQDHTPNPVFRVFIKMVLQAWEARVAAATDSGEEEAPTPPGIVLLAREQISQASRSIVAAAEDTPDNLVGMNLDDDDLPLSMMGGGFGAPGMFPGGDERQYGEAASAAGSTLLPSGLTHPVMAMGMSPFQWWGGSPMNLGLTNPWSTGAAAAYQPPAPVASQSSSSQAPEPMMAQRSWPFE